MSIHVTPATLAAAHTTAVLDHLASDLHRQPAGADTVLAGVELYSLIRWCMLKVERQRRLRDTHDADRLYDALTVAYERAGAFVGVSRGHAFYNVGALCEAVRDVAVREKGVSGDVRP